MDIDKLLAAIEIVESGAGHNNFPRMERSFLPAGVRHVAQGRTIAGTGRYVNAELQAKYNLYGSAVACSFSPWQIMYATALREGYTGPPWLLWDREVAEPVVRRHLNRIIASGADTPEKVADAWNSGSWKDNYRPTEYIAKFLRAWEQVNA